MDEAEAVTSLSQSTRRDEANQNIRKLLDNADSHKGLYILFATTPKFLEDPKFGAKSYPALWERIKDVLDINLRFPNKRGSIIPLLPLRKNDLVKLGNILVKIHGLAYGWEAEKRINQDAIKQYTEQFYKKSQEKLVRIYIRGLITFLDIAEENEDMDILNEMDNITFPDT